MLLARRRFFAVAGGAAFALSAGSVPFGSARAATAPQVRIGDLYIDPNAEDLEFSKVANDLNGKPVQVYGFMAPPLKPDLHFFVLASMPLNTCPFCDTAASWPSDILVVQLRHRQPVVGFDQALLVNGRLELGEAIDPDTGFVSRARIADAEYDVAKVAKPCAFGQTCPGA